MAFDHTDSDAFSRELTALIPRMRAFARTMCGDRTAGDDLAQEGLLKAWTARASYQPGTNLRAWVFTIMRNQFYSEKRRSWRSLPLDQEMAEQTLVATSDPTAAIELDELRRAMLLLPEEQREALILVGAGGCSYEEVAEMCDCAVGTIKSRVSRARDRLALIFAEASIPTDDIRPSSAMANILSQYERAGRVMTLAA
ncbi:sigma-70 family RNA polymerase sigma factor [Phenylobacterium sp.]|uniref:sigma-70 family RNA polymerase sigma factor n=1 Tax=Phenylobacterium sp. TaxID=1871053 RepID=UPI0025D29555|nr:sigma-70 family RNA polymerase sigma factor [Phenylobacterium sp.]